MVGRDCGSSRARQSRRSPSGIFASKLNPQIDVFAGGVRSRTKVKCCPFTDCKLSLDAQPELCDDRDTVTPSSKELSNLRQ